MPEMPLHPCKNDTAKIEDQTDPLGIKVLYMDMAAKKRFQAVADDSIEGVPIYYEVTGEIRAL